MLYKSQQETLNKLRKNHILAAGTGAGKTLMGIHHYLKHEEGEPLLIVCPAQKRREGGWDHEISMVNEYYGVNIEYEVLSVAMLAKRWESYKSYFIIFDECHDLKNPTSKRGKAAIKLTQNASGFLLLSATPASNGWIDTSAYFIMFRYFKNKTEFHRRYAVFTDLYLGDRTVKTISGWKDEHVLKNMWSNIALHVDKHQFADLPDIMYQDVRFKSSKAYKIIEKDRVYGDVAYDNTMSLQHGLRYHANIEDKVKYTSMLAEGTSENIVIFYAYKEEALSIKDTLPKDKTVFEVSGQNFRLPKKEDWSSIENSVTLVQYAAGSAGIELQYANLVIFYTPTFSFQQYEQALGRCYRNGQKNKVTVFQYKTMKTIEEHVYDALSQKKDFTDQLFEEVVG